jgi:acetyl-CoA C-acetyltransferase
MAAYMERHGVGVDAFDAFALNAHRNANDNPNAVFYEKQVTPEMVRDSRVIVPPLRLFDASPICDGAAAVVLGPAERHGNRPVRLLASAAATDRFRMADRPEPLRLLAVAQAVAAALSAAGVAREAVDFFELHDAFSIMACLQLEAAGFAAPGAGWRLAADGTIARAGAVPIATMGGLKARGHPIGATALYQTCEIVAQLTGAAGPAQLPNPRHALLCSVGGAAATVLVHAFGVRPPTPAHRATSSGRSPDRAGAAPGSGEESQ